MRLRNLCLAAVAALGLMPAASAEPVKLRVGWLLVPAEITPILFPAPGIARHNGVTYTIEPMRYQASSLLTAAIAAGELDIAPFGYSSFSLAVENAHLDLRIIADEDRDGAGSHFTTHFMVKKDGGIAKVEDLKGKALATNAVGSISDMAMRFMLRKHGINDARDVSVTEVALPNMNAVLAEGKVALIASVLPFYLDPTLQQTARTLFTGLDAIGPAEISMLTVSSAFLARNRAVLTDFLEDYLRALHWYDDPANRGAVLKAISDFTKLPPERFESWAFTPQDYYRDPEAKVDLGALQKNLDVQHELGYLDRPLEAKPYVDMSLVEAAAARIK